MNGGFSPLRGFMSRADYESVCCNLRLKNGLLWPIPIVLDVSEEFARSLGTGSTVALRDPEGLMLAALHVDEVWQPDRMAEVEAVYGTTSPHHPGVEHVLQRTSPWYVGGRLEGIQIPVHYDFRSLRLGPAELRAEFVRLGWRRIVAFQTRNPMHRAHQELTLRAAKKVEANLLLHPSVGMTKPGDVEYYVRVRCYQALLSKYPKDYSQTRACCRWPCAWSGPREAVWHAIIRKNHGCTHFIVGRDHAGPGNDAEGKAFLWALRRSGTLAKAPAGDRHYHGSVQHDGLPGRPGHLRPRRRDFPKAPRPLNISGTELRRRLSEGREIPSWFTFPEVARELQRSYPPRHRQGFTVFFTGLSGSGKSTMANVLRIKFLEMGGTTRDPVGR